MYGDEPLSKSKAMEYRWHSLYSMLLGRKDFLFLCNSSVENGHCMDEMHFGEVEIWMGTETKRLF